MATNALKQERLKELLNYSEETGRFTWKEKRGRVGVGESAGYTHKAGYIYIRIDGKLFSAHRLAWFYMRGAWPNQIDHINHDKSDNRAVNLRNVTRLENSKNLKLHKRNRSGVVGVCWRDKDNRWEANISCNNKSIYLGQFVDKEDAVRVRGAAEIKYGFHKNHGGVYGQTNACTKKGEP